MRKTLLILVLAMIGYYSYAQNSNPWPTSGNVGIGTTAPATLLHLSSGTDNTALTYTNNHNSYTASLDWYGLSRFMIKPTAAIVPVLTLGQFNDAAANGAVFEFFGRGNPRLSNVEAFRFILNNAYSITGTQDVVIDTYQTGTGTARNIQINPGGVQTLSLLTSGKVGIGTTDTQGYKLAVNGDAIAVSMTVKLHSAWPDYVFKPTYQLPKLSEIKTYIDQNQHLPELPSEGEVQKDGINLGEMNKLLVKKVEELTLYLIEKDKEVSEQRLEMNQIKEQLKALAKEVHKN